jgi:anti-sigma factor RsiW
MTCSELRGRLDAYARGTLSAADAAAFEEHVDTCASCEAFLAEAEARPAETQGLPKSVEPASDLWPGIHARLAPRHRGRARIAMPGWMLAAAAVLLIAVSSGITAVLLRPPQSRTAAPPTSAFSPLEVQYASAASELSAELERARGRLAPATVRSIERNLAVIDSALAESRRALAQDPGNATLERLVIAAWRQKMDFLRRATALSGES